MRVIDMVGQTFGMLAVTEMLPGSLCKSDCECGKRDFVTDSYSVRNGLTKSCGCLRESMLKEGLVRRTHGESVAGQWTPEYRAWVNMNSRCFIPSTTRFENWGGRGITVCPEWRESYPAFLACVGRKPTPEHSLDRYPDVNGNYEPGNVRWATPSEQARNTRKAALCSQ